SVCSQVWSVSFHFWHTRDYGYNCGILLGWISLRALCPRRQPGSTGATQPLPTGWDWRATGGESRRDRDCVEYWPQPDPASTQGAGHHFPAPSSPPCPAEGQCPARPLGIYCTLLAD